MELRIRKTLRGARVDVGLTQTEAAQMLGVTPGTLGNWEAGKSSPPAWMLDKISEIYGLPVYPIQFPKTGTGRSTNGDRNFNKHELENGIA